MIMMIMIMIMIMMVTGGQSMRSSLLFKRQMCATTNGKLDALAADADASTRARDPAQRVEQAAQL
jgi:hypothetical protein